VTLQRQDFLTEAKEWLNRLEQTIEADKALRHQDSSIEIESFFRDLLNLVFRWNLGNANTMFGLNQDSFDLSDESTGIAVQVTITTDAAKIRKTIRGFVGTHDAKYDRLVFAYPCIKVSESRADFSKDLKGFDFDANRDRISFGSILQRVQDFDIDRMADFIQLLRKELRPLGLALQLGVDQTLDTLIAVIEYMSRHSPINSIEPQELGPDQEEKLKRFQEYADYLLSQYRMNQSLHATVNQARDAIGYDTVRAAKIQTWLKIKSIEVLATHGGNAMAAFIHLVKTLLEKAHSQGTDAEETAVRFLLADEFIRCNVFPNPAK
jgi:hypothetical protein